MIDGIEWDWFVFFTSKDLLFVAPDEIPNADRAIVGTGGQFLVRRTETAHLFWVFLFIIIRQIIR